MILYVIQVTKDKKKIDEYKNIVAYGFPKIDNSDLCNKSRKGIYKVNRIWWEQFMKPMLDEIDDEEIEDEE